MCYVVIYSNGKACTNGNRPLRNLYDTANERCNKEFDETTSWSGSN